MKRILLILGGLILLVGLLLLTAGAAHLGQTPAKLTWTQPEFRSSLMTFAYKVYGNPKVENGRHFLSKITFKNTGEVPVTDFAISYKLQDYIPWTDPETMPRIPAGFSFAKLYYPRLPAEVTKLHAGTTCALQIKVQWKEGGQAREQTFRHDVLLHPINELTYCDLPTNEVESWYDRFDTSDFAVSMVTPNDPVVEAYAAQISKLAGGSVAGAGGGFKELYRVCGVAYDYMVHTGLRYAGAQGVPAGFDDVQSLVQTVRMPRDVILNNNGLCIELAIMWASVLQHLGVDAALVMVPGHCYVIAYSEGQGVPFRNGIPIECTAITPRAVESDSPVSFDGAVKMAQEETEQRIKAGYVIWLPVKQYQSAGFTAPELPEVDVPRVTEMLEKRLAPNQQVAERTNNSSQGQEQGGNDKGPGQQETAQDQGGGGNGWRSSNGTLLINVPPDLAPTPITTNPGGTLAAVWVNRQTSLECDVLELHGTNDVKVGWDYIVKSFAKYNVAINTASVKAGQNGLVFFYGTSRAQGIPLRWVAAGKVYPNNQLSYVCIGCRQDMWQNQTSNINALMNNVNFK